MVKRMMVGLVLSASLLAGGAGLGWARQTPAAGRDDNRGTRGSGDTAGQTRGQGTQGQGTQGQGMQGQGMQGQGTQGQGMQGQGQGAQGQGAQGQGQGMQGQGTQGQGQDAQGQAQIRLTSRDRSFFEEATRGGMAEVTLGRLARDRAQSEEVKNFAQRMVEDHSKFNDELLQIGGRLSLTAPANLNRKHQDLVDKLSKASGVGFDQQYMKAMVDDHKKDVETFRKHADRGDPSDNPQLKTFAATKLPTLQSHLQQAQQILDRIKRNQSARR